VKVQNFRRAPCCLSLSFVLVCLSNKPTWSTFAPADTVIVTPQTPGPAGVIVRDPQSGEPTGVIKEDAADAVIERMIPLPTHDDKLRAIRCGLKKTSRDIVRAHCAGNTTESDSPGGLVPTERISLEDTIKAYTLGAAFASRREKTEGSLQPGKPADLIVLSQDLFKIKHSEIGKTEVLLTMVGVKVVYQSATGLSPEAK
jgi:predicted amidohydrolase YtcJ